MTDADRIAELETALALLIEAIDVMGCYDRVVARLTDQVPAVKQARVVLGETAFRRVMERLEGEQHL